MTKLFIHDDAKYDLSAMIKNGLVKAVAEIVALLEQLASDDDLLDRLTQHGFGKRGVNDFYVGKWLEQWRQGKDLWSMKIWDLEDNGLKYRIIYAFIPQKQHYHVLGILPREFNYDAGHELTQRIIRAYEEL